MRIYMFMEDTQGRKHVFSQEIPNELVVDELGTIIDTFEILLASCGYDIDIECDHYDYGDDSDEIED